MKYPYCPYCLAPITPGQVCGHCGKNPEAYIPEPHHFPAGQLLAERYYIGKTLGEGGFGITYLGLDAKLMRRVAVKEYFPRAFVRRDNNITRNVTCYAGSGDVFEKGRSQFLLEAQTLAKLDDIPEIVRVLDFFAENNSAYIVMEFLEGETLKDILMRRGPLPAAELLTMLEPVLKGMEAMHQDGLIHRDISPDNLMLIRKTGRVKLMDFGCAREVSGHHTMTIMLKPGFAPAEQYTGHEQGPWTDVYALSATIYYCLTGKIPPESMRRMGGESLTPPSALGSDIPWAQEQALLRGMAVFAQDRLRSIQALYDGLYGTVVPMSYYPPSAPSAAVPGRTEYLGGGYGVQPPVNTGAQPGYDAQGTTGQQPGVAGAQTGYGVSRMPGVQTGHGVPQNPGTTGAQTGYGVPQQTAQQPASTGNMAAPPETGTQSIYGVLAAEAVKPETTGNRTEYVNMPVDGGTISIYDLQATQTQQQAVEAGHTEYVKTSANVQPVDGGTISIYDLQATQNQQQAVEAGHTEYVKTPAGVQPVDGGTISIYDLQATQTQQQAAEAGHTEYVANKEPAETPEPTGRDTVIAPLLTDQQTAAADGHTEFLSSAAAGQQSASSDGHTEYITPQTGMDGGTQSIYGILGAEAVSAAGAKGNNAAVGTVPNGDAGAAADITAAFRENYSNSGAAQTKEKKKKKKLWLIPVILLLLLLAAGAFWFLHPHMYSQWEILEEPTCQQAGLRERVCFCGMTESEDIEALAHTVVIDKAEAATCQQTGYTEGSHCSVCGQVLKARVTVPRVSHDNEVIPAVAPTCTATGWTEGMKCGVCGMVFVEPKEVPMVEHTPVVDPAVAPTCSKEGRTEGVCCDVCGEILQEPTYLSKLDHTPVKDQAVPATCKSTGLTEGSHCSVCNEVLTKQEVTAKTNHTPVTDKAVAATCQSTGKTEGSHCSVCGEVLKKQESTPKTGHSPETIPAVEVTCDQDGYSEGKRCSVCGYEIEKPKVTAKATGHKFNGTTCAYCDARKWYVEMIITADHYEGDSLIVYVSYTIDGYDSGAVEDFEIWAHIDDYADYVLLSGKSVGSSGTLSISLDDYSGKTLYMVAYASDDVLVGASYKTF